MKEHFIVNHLLDEVEVRILGCLIEKERTTPETYPLTLNALTRACNQKSSRNPVVSFNEKIVIRTLDELSFNKKMVRRVIDDGSRVPKYRHTFTEISDLIPEELAIMCVLMLRGPQTLGEIRIRTERLHSFNNLEKIEILLLKLMEQKECPLVSQLPRQPGTKESRYAHLLSGNVNKETPEHFESPTREVISEKQRITNLEKEMERLQNEFKELKQTLIQFKNQFD